MTSAASRDRARTSTITRVVLGAMALAFLATCGVWWLGHAALDDVSAAAGVPECTGTTVRSAEAPGSIEGPAVHRVSSIAMKAGFECDLTIWVPNESGRKITLDQITIPGGGPDGGAAFEVTAVNGVPIEDSGDVNAVVDPEMTLGSDEDGVLGLQIRFREDVCSSAESSTWIQPTLGLSSLTASREIAVSSFPVFEGTPDSSCDS